MKERADYKNLDIVNRALAPAEPNGFKRVRLYEVTCPECLRKVETEWCEGGVLPARCPCGYLVLSEIEGNPKPLGKSAAPDMGKRHRRMEE
jgi:hypothetical protein